MRPWHYHYSPEAAAVLPRYRCWALIDGVLREYTQASIVRLSGAGEYLGVGLHVRSVFTDGGAEKVQQSAFFLLPGREVVCSLLHMDTTNTAYTPQILADRFPDLGVCPFCRTRQMVHSESGLCRNCLPAARAGWNPMQDETPTAKPVAPMQQITQRKHRKRCTACSYTVAGWALCAHHWQEQNKR